MKQTIYVITFYELNHNSQGYRNKPLDSRFIQSQKNYVYYLIDENLPEPLRGKDVLFEKQIDSLLYKAGANHLGEWSFLLAEAKHSFCQYPMFMISSRFYEKNTWLQSDLNKEWDTIFNYLQDYGYGYLPSYDRPIAWIDYEGEAIKYKGYSHRPFPITKKALELIDELYQIKIPEDYKFMSDWQCNYIGFKTRQQLLDYVEFYQPLINYFLDESYSIKNDLSSYVVSPGVYRNEKPLTLYLEALSHLYFFKKCKKFFALHYDGLYEINEKEQKLRKLARVNLSTSESVKWRLRWNWMRVKNEIWYPCRNRIVSTYTRLPAPIKEVYRRVKFTKNQ